MPTIKNKNKQMLDEVPDFAVFPPPIQHKQANQPSDTGSCSVCTCHQKHNKTKINPSFPPN